MADSDFTVHEHIKTCPLKFGVSDLEFKVGVFFKGVQGWSFFFDSMYKVGVALTEWELSEKGKVLWPLE